MPYPDHFLLSYGGTLGSAGEIWSNNIRFVDNADGSADPDPEAVLPGIRTAIATLFAKPAAKIGIHCVCTYAKFNKIAPSGDYASSSESNTLFFGAGQTIPGGAGNTSVMPYNVSVCITWLTGVDRGRASKGRIFAPGATDLALTSAGQMATATATGMATAYAQFISDLADAVNTLPGQAMNPAVVSGLSGTSNRITSVQVGTVPDTMRSRRNQLVESRQTVAVP